VQQKHPYSITSSAICWRCIGTSSPNALTPGVTRVAVLGDTSTPTGPAQFGVIQAVAPSLRVEVSSLNKRDAGEIERTVTACAIPKWRGRKHGRLKLFLLPIMTIIGA
jgi:hypothetical protein